MNEANLQTTNLQTMERFLDQLATGGDFTDIPMREDATFTGPMASANRADDYRSICAQFAAVVSDISVRTMVEDNDVVHAVYDVDMGLPSGPLPTSHTVQFVDGAFATIEVIFDAAAVMGVAS